MEVVCLILGPMLASKPCLPVFWILTSLHLLSLLLKMFFYYSCENQDSTVITVYMSVVLPLLIYIRSRIALRICTTYTIAFHISI